MLISRTLNLNPQIILNYNMSINQLKEVAVIVNGVSGCLFQAFDNTCTYVLTATHNITDWGVGKPEIIRFIIENGAPEEVDISPASYIVGTNFFPHPELDVCIIKLPKIEGLPFVTRIDNLDTNNTGFTLMGYPDARREGNDNKVQWFRPDENVTILHTISRNMRESRIPDTPKYEEVIGHSGGCLVKYEGGNIMIAGIQNKVVDSETEQLGRVEFTTMEAFDEIIQTFHETLLPMFPGYLRDFSFFKNKTFPLNVGALYEDSVVLMRKCLRDMADEIISSQTTPFSIRSFFKERILVSGQSHEVLQGSTIWKVWLEFLTILNAVRPVNWTDEHVSAVFNSYRLLYSDNPGDWTEELQNLVYSDYRGLPIGGTVIVGTPNKPNYKYEIEKGKIPKITRATEKTMMKTDDGINFPFDSYRFVHIDYFTNKTLIDKLQDYGEIVDENELITKLKEQFDELFRIQ